MPLKRFAELTAKLSHCHTSFLIQFCTNHVLLQAHLTCIRKTEAATCLTCSAAAKMVAHFLLVRPTYTLHHAVHYCPLGFSSHNPAFN
ncbi:hypothetical protein C8Q73DRAFT_634979 [Cubamyces lactineus]|nr:hypothetical protein C8Q73DRAFT_634979 [Cubamyces lactineus]